MAAVLYLLGLLSIALGAIIAVDPFVEALDLGLSLSVAYQAIAGGILLFVMARLLQHAAATARNTERFYRQVLQNPATAEAFSNTAAEDAQEMEADRTSSEFEAAEPTADMPERKDPAEEKTDDGSGDTKSESEPTVSESDAEQPPSGETTEGSASSKTSKQTEAEPLIVEHLEYRGYMIDKLSNGKVNVHTAEGPMLFDNLETFQRELELSGN